MTDRDHFAAAALTGFASQPRFNCGSVLTLTANQCYELADAMLRERERKNHDAAPAARAAPSESSAPLGKGLGTGDTTEPVAWATFYANGSTESVYVLRKPPHAEPLYRHPPVTKPMPKEKQAEVSDRSKPITGPDPDSRVWETNTPATHATRGEGSEHRECTEPVAWATFYPNGSTASVYVGRQPQHAEPLYRHPPCQDFSQKNLTLTDCERGAIERAVDSIASTMPYESQQGLADWKTLRGLLRRLGGGR